MGAGLVQWEELKHRGRVSPVEGVSAVSGITLFSGFNVGTELNVL